MALQPDTALPSPELARKVRNRGGSLRPCTVRTRLGLKRQADFYARRMVKQPHRCEFHCLAELYHAALLEGDPLVEYYVPQPFKLSVNGAGYIPDIYYVRAEERVVGELKPRGEFPAALRAPLEAFFSLHGMRFVVISNESVWAREVAAQNWLVIVQHLLVLDHLETREAEWDLIETLEAKTSLTFGELVDAGHRAGTEQTEAAIYRLLHRGKLTADLEHTFWGYDTALRLCS